MIATLKASRKFCWYEASMFFYLFQWTAEKVLRKHPMGNVSVSPADYKMKLEE